MSGLVGVVFCIICAALVICANAQQQQPGRAAMWSVGGQEAASPAQYNTKSLEPAQLPQYLDAMVGDSNSNVQIVAYLQTSDGRPALSHASVVQSIRDAKNAVVFPALYMPSSSSSSSAAATTTSSFSAAADAVLSSKTMQQHDALSLQQFIALLDEKKKQISSDKVNSYVVTLTGHESEHAYLQSLHEKLGSAKAILVALAEPSADARVPAKEDGLHEQRFLASTGKSSDLLDGKPHHTVAVKDDTPLTSAFICDCTHTHTQTHTNAHTRTHAHVHRNLLQARRHGVRHLLCGHIPVHDTRHPYWHRNWSLHLLRRAYWLHLHGGYSRRLVLHKQRNATYHR